MKPQKKSKNLGRKTRQKRVRSRIWGTNERPRFCVHRSLKNLFVQLIDDDAGKTVISMHSKTSKLSGDAGDRKGRQAQAYLLGIALAKEAQKNKINNVVFDRAGYKYHGIVRALADGAREGGLNF